ncbi:hypothetical protein L0Z66_01760 [Phaeobacter sp. BS34]
MTLRRPAALAALLLIPSLGAAQEAPVAPTTSAPQIITQSPATTAPAALGEAHPRLRLRSHRLHRQHPTSPAPAPPRPPLTF